MMVTLARASGKLARAWGEPRDSRLNSRRTLEEAEHDDTSVTPANALQSWSLALQIHSQRSELLITPYALLLRVNASTCGHSSQCQTLLATPHDALSTSSLIISSSGEAYFERKLLSLEHDKTSLATPPLHHQSTQ